jgi:lipopolysaccharide biosynthesis protein
MRSICFFSSYYTQPNLPVYVKFYLEELTKHFSETVFITSQKEMLPQDKAFLEEKKIRLIQTANEGYDFGMWYKGMKEYNINDYDRVGLVNDSCILFGKLDTFFQWLDKENPDYCGFTDSYLMDYHIQSYFLVVNKRAIPFVLEYFNRNGIVKELSEVIKTYEVGLSKYFIDKDLKLKAFYNIPNKGEYNYALMGADGLIKLGFPMIKKKIISRGYVAERWRSMVALGFNPFPSHYIKEIKKKQTIPANLFDAVMKSKGVLGELKFYAVSLLAVLSRARRKKV